MLGIYFAPLIAQTNVAMCKIPFRASENKIIWRSINFCWTLHWVQVWEEAKWNGLSGLWYVHHLLYLLHGREANSFLWVAAGGCPPPSPPKWSVKLSWGLRASHFCSLVSFKGSFLFSWRDSSCQWWTYYKKNNSILSNQLHRFTHYVEMFLFFSLSPSVMWLVFFPSPQNLSKNTSEEKLCYWWCIGSIILQAFRFSPHLKLSLSGFSYFLTLASSGLCWLWEASLRVQAEVFVQIEKAKRKVEMKGWDEGTWWIWWEQDEREVGKRQIGSENKKGEEKAVESKWKVTVQCGNGMLEWGEWEGGATGWQPKPVVVQQLNISHSLEMIISI